ncbi:MAG: hypothetical protein KDK45_25365, partial [Leptospiraceae bacterium]|nr:hypothetical protein [Leptospiraceae bacterium]
IVFLAFPSLFSLWAGPVLEKIDITRFPSVKLQVRESRDRSIQSEKLKITESLGPETQYVEKVNIIRVNGFRPIHALFSVHISNFDSINKEALGILKGLLESLGDRDRVGLQFFANETAFIRLDLDKYKALAQLENLSPGYGNRQNYSLVDLLKDYQKTELPTIAFIINPEMPTILDEPIDEIVKGFRKHKIPVHIIGLEATANEKLAESTKGRYYSIKEKIAYTGLKSDLYAFRKIPPILEYSSVFQKKLNKIFPNTIRVNFIAGKEEYNLRYKASYLNIIKTRFAKVEYFYGASFALLFFCLLVLYLINRNIRNELEKERKKQLEKVKENDLYYQENVREEALEAKRKKVKASKQENREPSLTANLRAVEQKVTKKLNSIEEAKASSTPTAMLTQYEIEGSLPEEEISRGDDYDT